MDDERFDEITIPNNIKEFITTHYGVNLSVNYNGTDGLNGYGHILHKTVVVYMLSRKCNRCGYDTLLSDNDDFSKCIRHTYDDEYKPVFFYSFGKDKMSLEECFGDWLSINEKNGCVEMPIKEKYY